jgi:hypothetical protein
MPTNLTSGLTNADSDEPELLTRKMDGEPAGSSRGLDESMACSSRQENPVALLQRKPLAVYLEYRRASQDHDPFIEVLVEFEHLVELAAQDLFDERLAHLDDPFDTFTFHRSEGAVEKPTTSRNEHKVKATPRS